MMRWIGICCLIFVVAIWGIIGMSAWLVVGPWWLVKSGISWIGGKRCYTHTGGNNYTEKIIGEYGNAGSAPRKN